MEEILQLSAGFSEGCIWPYRWAGQKFPMHRHTQVEVNLVVEGTATYVMRERCYELSLGSMVWLFPRQDHLLLDQSPNYRMWIAVFKPDLIERLWIRRGQRGHCGRLIPLATFACCSHAARATRLDILFGDLLAALPHLARFNAGMAYALLSAWASYLEADDTGEGFEVHPAVERAAAVAPRDASSPVGLEDLAYRVGLSPSHLCRLFKAQMGVSLVTFSNRQRLDRFLHLYGHGRRRTMMDAALDAGFGSYAQFYRVFTKLIGCTPPRVSPAPARLLRRSRQRDRPLAVAVRPSLLWLTKQPHHDTRRTPGAAHAARYAAAHEVNRGWIRPISPASLQCACRAGQRKCDNTWARNAMTER